MVVSDLWTQIRRRWLGLSPGATDFDQRGFRGGRGEVRKRLEEVGSTFVAGYHLGLETAEPGIGEGLRRIPLELRGFAVEGAAMGLALLDCLAPQSCHRIPAFLNGAGEPHRYMVHVGVGWVWARLPWGRWRLRKHLDPLLRWLAFDGWGFHEAFFRWPRYIGGQPPPARLRGYERRAFNQGLGRCWWFVNGGEPRLIQGTIAGFPRETQADMWSGVGLAATYSGILPEDGLVELRQSAGPLLSQLAQGAAFAAKARVRAGNATPYTSLATEIFSGLNADQAAALCDSTLENLPADGAEPAYEAWRQRIQHHFGQTENLEPARAKTSCTSLP